MGERISGDSALVVGQTMNVPHRQATLQLNDFHYKVQPIMTKSGMIYQPIDYVSNVTVVGKDGIPKRNDSSESTRSTSTARCFTKRSDHSAYVSAWPIAARGCRALGQNVSDGGRFHDSGQRTTDQVTQFVPTVDRQTGQPSSDPRVNDPAVALQVVQNGQVAGAALVPMNTWIDVGNGWRVTPEKYALVSGLQYRYDPGVPLVGIGAFVLLAGLVISFYFLPARLYVRVDETPQPSVWSVGLAATTVKGYECSKRSLTNS